MTHALKLLALLPGLALAPATAAMADFPGPVPPDNPVLAPPQITECKGGAQEAINGLTRNFPAVLAAGEIPNTRVNGGASTGPGLTVDDLYVLTFSAEADSVAAASGWTVQAQYSFNNIVWFNMPPVGPNTFHQGDRQETHTMTWCKRIFSPNNVFFRVVGAGFGTPVMVDDYTTLVERSD